MLEYLLHCFSFVVVFVVVTILTHSQVFEDFFFVGFAQSGNAFRKKTAKFKVVVS